MPHFAHSHNSEPPKFPSDNALMDDNSELPLIFHDDEEDISSESPSPASSASSSTSSLSSSASSVHSMHSSYSKKSNGSTSMTSKIKSLSKVRRSPKLSRKGNGGGAPPVNLHTAAQRKNHFSVRENRKNVVFGPEVRYSLLPVYLSIHFFVTFILLLVPMLTPILIHLGHHNDRLLLWIP